jgi:predicted RecA/RadA family phage recombinase
MKNFVQKGDVVTFTAPSGGVTSGTPVVINGLCVIPAFSAAETYECEGVTQGVFSLPKKATDTPAQFAKAYWDAALGEVTTTSAAMKLIGVFMDDYANGVLECEVRLNGVSI